MQAVQASFATGVRVAAPKRTAAPRAVVGHRKYALSPDCFFALAAHAPRLAASRSAPTAASSAPPRTWCVPAQKAPGAGSARKPLSS